MLTNIFLGDVNLSLYKPDKYMNKRRTIENILKDLDPGIRDSARRFLEELDQNILMDKQRVLKLLKKRGLIG